MQGRCRGRLDDANFEPAPQPYEVCSALYPANGPSVTEIQLGTRITRNPFISEYFFILSVDLPATLNSTLKFMVHALSRSNFLTKIFVHDTCSISSYSGHCHNLT